MKVFLTGGTGFIGSHIAAALVEKQHEVLALVRSGSSTPPGTIPAEGDLSNLPWQQLEEFGPELLIHSAWIATPGVYLESEQNDKLVDDSLRMADRLFSFGLKHMTSLGTCFEYAPCVSPLTEESPLAPASRYARAKCQLGEHLAACAKKHGRSLSWPRIFFPYGKGEPPQKLISHLLSCVLTDINPELKYPNAIRDFIHVSDVADALVCLSEKMFHGKVNIGTGRGVSVGEIHRTVLECMNKPFVLESRHHDPTDAFVADVTRLKSIWWPPGTSLQDGIGGLMRAIA